MGLNKSGNIKETSSHIYNLKPKITMLIEIRVKRNKAQAIRDKL